MSPLSRWVLMLLCITVFLWSSLLSPAVAAGDLQALYIGCFADVGSRVLSYQAPDSGATPDSCVTACKLAAYRYAGVQDGGQCFCGNSYASSGPSLNCTKACVSDPSQTCGGSWANSVYRTALYIGCFKDTIVRDLPYNPASAWTTPPTCVQSCLVAGARYAGVQYGEQCYCGNSYGTFGSSLNCTMPCNWDNSQTCGGEWANSVYRTGSPTCGESAFVCPRGYMATNGSTVCSSLTCGLSDCCRALYIWETLTSTAGFGSRYAHCTVTLGNQLLVIAGWKSTGYQSDVWASPDGLSWTALTEYAAFAVRGYMGCAVLGSQVFVMAGLGSGISFNDTWSSPTGASWVTLGDAGFSPRYWLGSAAFLGKVWIIGGFTSANSDSNEVWSSVNGMAGNWTQSSTSGPIFAPRDALAVTTFIGRLWVIGGCKSDVYGNCATFYNDVWFSTDGVTWVVANSSAGFTPRDFPVVVGFLGQLWMVGGWQYKATSAMSDVWTSPDGRAWAKQSPNLPLPLTKFSGAVLGRRFVTTGGSTGGAYAGAVVYSVKMGNLTCGESNFTCPGAFTPVNGSTVCRSLTCGLDECCTVPDPSTCGNSSLVCPPGYTANPAWTKCSSLMCNLTDCCTARPMCGPCPTGFFPKNESGWCFSDPCSVAECCFVIPTCGNSSVICPEGRAAKNASTFCGTLPCTAQDCCTAPVIPTCGTTNLTCPEGRAAKNASTVCPALPCTVQDCCTDGSSSAAASVIPIAVGIAVGVSAVAVLGTLGVLWWRRRRSGLDSAIQVSPMLVVCPVAASPSGALPLNMCSGSGSAVTTTRTGTPNPLLRIFCDNRGAICGTPESQDPRSGRSLRSASRSSGNPLADLCFESSVIRDVAWEQTYCGLLEKFKDIIYRPDALLEAARGLAVLGSVRAVEFAEQCMEWAKQRYPGDHVLAVATCRFWTAGEEDPIRLAPYRVMNNALRPASRKSSSNLLLAMPAVCLLTWALDHLPPEFVRKPTTVYRVVPWLFPSPISHDPHAHFPEGATITTYDFRAASRSLAIAANENFSKLKWVGEHVGEAGRYCVLEELLGPSVDLNEARLQAESSLGSGPIELPNSRFTFEFTPIPGEEPAMFIEDRAVGQRLRVFPTRNFSTHFVFENALASPLTLLSFYKEENEVLFPPLSRFLVKEVEKVFPDNPDKVTLVYLSSGQLSDGDPLSC